MVPFMNLFNSVLAVLIITLCTETALFCSCHNSSFIRCKQGERQTLLKLRQSFEDSFHRLSSWEGNECCVWKGVSCDEANGHVIKLNLRAPSQINKMRAITDEERRPLVAREVNPCLLELRYLEHLDLSGNDFQFSAIPQFSGSMKQLRYLNISNARFNGTAVLNYLRNLTALRVLDVSNDQGPSWSLRVDDVRWISNLSSLEHIGMAGIDLSEAQNLFQVLGKLPYLLSLHLSQCLLNNSHLSRHPFNSTFHSLRHLNLAQNNFDGPIPIALQNLTSLRTLDLGLNLLNSSIPNWFGNLKNLVHLNLAANDFSSIEKGLLMILGNMCHLKSLDFSINQFQGEKIGNYRNLSGCLGHDLETLNLDYGRFSGNIPDWVGMLKSLKGLHLANNQLNGTIPESIGQLSNLETLDLSVNSLKGVVSEVHFASLSRLKMLSISSNSLTIKLKHNWIPPFQLEYIDMGSCKFGTRFPQWLQTQSKATTLYLSNTSISGALPHWIKNMNLEELDLSHNQINGILPYFSSNLKHLDLSYNSISGVLHQKIGTMLPKLRFLMLSNNNMSGPIPNSLCHVETLIILQLSKNYLSGNIPGCWGSLHHQAIEVMDLSSNYLSGVIPTSLGRLHLLSWLDLSHNNLQGVLPLALKNCTYLKLLDVGENDLSGNIPQWIGDAFLSLEIVRLRRNQFNGTIPRQLCQQLSYNLHILDLAENNLQGRIPHCIGNFTAMVYHPYTLYAEPSNYLPQWVAEHLDEVMKGIYLEYTSNLRLLVGMDLSRNKLEGPIPEELTLLTGLIGLNLSFNPLSGEIPNTIGELEWLESLDLSSNQLSGMIPAGMTSLTKLSYLNLSHNNLSGQIPTGNQLQTLVDPSIYAANPLLCGALVRKRCLDDMEPLPHHPGNEDGGDDNPASDKMWFYIVIMSGFATGFWGVLGVLIFKKSWRGAYFLFLDRCKDWVLVHVALKMASVKHMIY